MTDTDPAAELDVLLREYRRRYPDALASLAQLRTTPDSPPWPEWCWLPMGAAGSYCVMHRAPQDIARVAALTTWRLGRGVFIPDDDVATVAVAQLAAPAAEWRRAAVPSIEALARLPEWCVYIAMPAAVRAELGDLDPGVQHPRGVFAHLEHDINTGRAELRLVVDFDGTWDGLLSTPVYLGRGDLGSAMADVEANMRAGAQGAQGVDLRALHRAPADGAIGAAVGVHAFWVLPLLLALLDPAAEIWDPQDPTAAPRPAAADEQGRWVPARTTRIWQVTYRRAPQLRVVH